MHLVPVLTEPRGRGWRDRSSCPQRAARGAPSRCLLPITPLRFQGAQQTRPFWQKKSSLTRKTICLPLARPGGLFQKQKSTTM